MQCRKEVGQRLLRLEEHRCGINGGRVTSRWSIYEGYPKGGGGNEMQDEREGEEDDMTDSKKDIMPLDVLVSTMKISQDKTHHDDRLLLSSLWNLDSDSG